jgi:hypothetical protein
MSNPTLNAVNWTLLDQVQIPAKPAGVWTRVSEYLTGTGKIKIVAEGTWCYGPQLSCSPDGAIDSTRLTDKCLSTAAPIGALIAKIGGSSTSLPGSGNVIPVGSFCVIDTAETTPQGPLFLTINDEPAGFADNSGQLTVKIYSSP